MTPELIAELKELRHTDEADVAGAMRRAWDMTIRFFSLEDRLVAKDLLTHVLGQWFIEVGASDGLREWITQELAQLPWDEAPELDS